MLWRSTLFAGCAFIFISCTGAKSKRTFSIEEFINAQLPGATSGRKQYLVVQVADHQVLAKGSFMPGYITWRTDHELELFDAPGIITDSAEDTENRKILTLQRPKR